MRPREIVGYRIREERKARHWSQAKLAEIMSGLLPTTWYPQTVGAAEQGERAFTVDDLVALRFALDRTLEQLTTPPPGETVDLGRDVTVTPDTVAATASIPTPTVEERLVADLERATQAIVENVKAGNLTYKGNEVKVRITKAKTPAKTTAKKRGKK